MKTYTIHVRLNGKHPQVTHIPYIETVEDILTAAHRTVILLDDDAPQARRVEILNARPGKMTYAYSIGKQIGKYSKLYPLDPGYAKHKKVLILFKPLDPYCCAILGAPAGTPVFSQVIRSDTDERCSVASIAILDVGTPYQFFCRDEDDTLRTYRFTATYRNGRDSLEVICEK